MLVCLGTGYVDPLPAQAALLHAARLAAQPSVRVRGRVAGDHHHHYHHHYHHPHLQAGSVKLLAPQQPGWGGLVGPGGPAVVGPGDGPEPSSTSLLTRSEIFSTREGYNIFLST